MARKPTPCADWPIPPWYSHDPFFGVVVLILSPVILSMYAWHLVKEWWKRRKETSVSAPDNQSSSEN